MKICELIASNGNGGLESHFVDLCNGLAAKGHQVNVIVPQNFSGIFSHNIIIHHLHLNKSRRNLFLLWSLYKTIHHIAPDIVHGHASKGANLLAMIKRFIPYPCVATIHNIKSNLNGYKKMDAVIGVSKGVLAQFTHPTKELIYNGLDVKSTQHSQSKLVDLCKQSISRPIILSIGRLVEAKDFAMLINAWQGIDADLAIVGDGPLRKSLENQIESLNLSSSIHLLGYVNNASSLIKSADLIVISSKREGFNYVMAEALLQQKPVLSTDVPAPNEILPKQFLTPPADSIAMHDKIEQCLADLDSVNAEFETLYNWSQKTFSLESMVSATENFFLNITKAK
jgi:glycosyltransferase involved in cell wall biosynthesis